MNTIYIFLIILSILLFLAGITVLILYLRGKFSSIPLKYGDFVKIKNTADGYYWSVQPTNQLPWIYGSVLGQESTFQILDASGNSSGKNVLNGDMIQIKVNGETVRYPLFIYDIADCSPFWGDYNKYIPQNFINEYSENLFQIKTVKDNDTVNINEPTSILQNKNRMCGSKNVSPAPVCSNSDVNNRFMFITNALGEYYLGNCNYTGNCSLCEQNKMNWILEKVEKQ